MMPKYPRVVVKLVGEDGNAFFIMGKVKQALEASGVPESEVREFITEATSGDYNACLRAAMHWVEVI